jgi:hypothetical protein
VLQAFHIPQFDHWVFGTYFSAQFNGDALTMDEVTRTSGNYFRASGVAGPIGTATLLALSVGSWLMLLTTAKYPFASRLLMVGLLAVLLAVFLTGSRLGMLSAGGVLINGGAWWLNSSSSRRLMGNVLPVVAVFVALTISATTVNDSFGKTASVSTYRVADTVPKLLRGEPDASLQWRFLSTKNSINLDLVWGRPMKQT